MSVVGIGTDIVDISRIEKMREAVQLKLAKRVLTATELIIYHENNFPHRYLAKRWAAKEAASKALGTGIASGVSFQHFEISSLASGQPQLALTETALSVAKQLGASHWHISISDENNLASAFVVLSQ